MDTLFSGIGQIRKSDQNYSYLLKDRTYIEIFEYTDLNNINLNEVNFGIQRKFPSFKNIWGTVLNEDLGDEVPVISIKDELPFQNTLNVSFNKNAPLTLIRNSADCRAYFGSLNKMLLGNANNEPLVLFDFTKVTKTLIAFYKNKKRKKFLIIVITSDKKPLDENCINLLKCE